MTTHGNRTQRVVVVTGGTAGVGRAVVRAFARTGAHVGILARDPARLQATAAEVEASGARVCAVSADVADSQQVDEAAQQIEDTLGPIDVWVNNAMTTVFAPLAEITPDEFRRATEVTYLGTVYGTMAALVRMKARNRGVIIQAGSALSYRGIPLQSAYCGAKHAIRGFTDSLRCELLHDGSGIHVGMVHLPAMNTPQFAWCRSRMPNKSQPVPPIFQPEVAARAIVWAAEHRRREVHVGYPTVVAIWGNKFLPWVADRYLARTGYQSQQSDEPLPADREDNLFVPVQGNFGAHGRFDGRSRGESWQWWVTTHRGRISAAIAGCALLAGALAFSKRGESAAWLQRERQSRDRVG